MTTNERIEKGIEPEVSVQFAAADILGTLTYENKIWTLYVEDTGFDDKRVINTPEQKELKLQLSTIEASAVMALFIGYGEEREANEIVCDHMYKVIEKVFANVPMNLRVIP